MPLMSTAYPIAANGKTALKSPGDLVRTRYAADEASGDDAIAGLETDWITLSTKNKTEMMKLADEGRSAGYVQLYENSDGSPVLAVTYWKLVKKAPPRPKPAPKPKDTGDTTDDLYFRKGRTKPYSRKKKVDPNQLDLFQATQSALPEDEPQSDS